MQEVATIGLLVLRDDEPGVRLSAGDEFMALSPVARISLLMAAIQLCGAAIGAICDDNPNESIDLMEMMDAMSINPSDHTMN